MNNFLKLIDTITDIIGGVYNFLIHEVNNFLGWVGTITGIIGGIHVALNSDDYSRFGYIWFMVSAINWMIQGIKNNDKPLILLNIGFICINILGIFHWFY